MLAGASVYVMYLAQILVLRDELLYAASALLGLGAALLWTAQVQYISACSTQQLPSWGWGAALLWTAQVQYI